MSTVRTVPHHPTIHRQSRAGSVFKHATNLGHPPSPSWYLATTAVPTLVLSPALGSPAAEEQKETLKSPPGRIRTLSRPEYMQFPTTTRLLPLPLPTDCTQTVSMLLKIRDYRTSTIYPSTVTATSHIRCRCANLETLFIDRPGIDVVKPRVTITAATPSTTTLVLCSPTFTYY